MRAWPTVDEKTVHLIGDVHVGHIYKSRLAKVLADFSSGFEDSPPAARVQVGDATHYNEARQYEEFIAWMDSLPPSERTLPNAREWCAIGGNHDRIDNETRLEREDEEDSYGYGEKGDWNDALSLPDTYSVDLDFVRLLMVSWNNPGTSIWNQARLDFLDQELTAAGSQKCWVVSHAPLWNTVQGPLTGKRAGYSSLETGFYQQGPATDSESKKIKDVLAAHENAEAWLCGHTHSSLTAPGIVTTLELGGKNVCHVNAGALIKDPSDDISDKESPLRSVYLTREVDAISVRWRDHALGEWVGPLPGGRAVRVEV